MNFKKYINMILMKLSKKYQFNLIEVTTYKDNKKYRSIKCIIYETKNVKVEGKLTTIKEYYDTIEVRNDRDLLIELKELM